MSKVMEKRKTIDYARNRKTATRKRRKADRKRQNQRNRLPEMKPEYVEAFMIVMLHKIGGSQTLTIKMLEAFSAAAEGKKTIPSYDAKTKSVTITAPDYEMPGKILVPQLKIDRIGVLN